MSTLSIFHELYERLNQTVSRPSRFSSQEEFIEHALDLAEAKGDNESVALQELGQLLDTRRKQPAIHKAPSVASLRARFLSSQ